MAGFWDLLALALAWKAAAVGAWPPYHTAAGQVWLTGAAAAALDAARTAAGQVYVPGSAPGQLHG